MHRKLMVFGISIVLAVLPAASSGSKKKKSVARSTVTSASVSRGKMLYRLYQCADCHSINKEGNKEGVSLDKIAIRRSGQFMLEQILDPEKHVQKNSKKFNGDPNLMPAQEIEKEEARAIVSYLKSLR